MSETTSPTQPGSSILSLPQPLRKASFANLAKFFGIGGAFSTVVDSKTAEDELSHEAEADEDEDDEDVDDESLMWDAQAALIAHQPSLAIERYTKAALPPYRSAAACLALGNLLTRGTGFTTTPTTPPADTPSIKGKEREREVTTAPFSPLVSPISPPAFSRFLHTFFTSPENVAQPPMTSPPPPEKKYDLVSNGWAMRKEGKRAVRDVEGMGVAGGWLVLGIGWTVDAELQKVDVKSTHAREIAVKADHQVSMVDDDEMLVMSKGKTPMRLHLPPKPACEDGSPVASTVTSQHPSSSDMTSATHTTDTIESEMIETPFSEHGAVTRDFAAETKTLKLIYDLLQPLLHLYRHGHIQAADPVYLPPITSSQLPAVLKPAGDMQKRRNAWALGAVVAERLLQTSMFKAIELGEDASKKRAVREWQQLVCGVRNIATYILGMTGEARLREGRFRSIVAHGPCGLSTADNVVRQAAKRLDIINTPSEPPTPDPSHDRYPFPEMGTLKPRASRSRRSKSKQTITSRKSCLSSVSIAPVPERRSSTSSRSTPPLSIGQAKPCNSSVSPGMGHGYSSSVHTSPVDRSSALDSLRRVSQASMLTNAGRHRRIESCASMLSFVSVSPATVTRELVVSDTTPAEAAFLSPPRASASEALRRVSASSTEVGEEDKHWPSLDGWTMATTPPAGTSEDPMSAAAANIEPPHKRLREKLEPTMRSSASSPNIHARLLPASSSKHKHPSSTFMKPTPSSASLLGGDAEIASIDPTLAAAELASALTTHVCCSVCAVKGVNFPECRKCGMRFCSRDCRVGVKGAGDGKKHLCGAWESRKRRMGGGLGVSVVQDGVGVAESLGQTPTLASVRAF